MLMLAEAIELIRKMGATESKALAPDFVMPPEDTEPDYVYFQRTADGLLERKTAETGPRDYTMYRVKDFVAAVGRLVGGKRLVCVGKCGVVGIMDEERDRRDRVTMPLTYTGPFAALSNIHRESRSQDSFIDFLRIDLAGCVEPDVVSLFRQLKFNNNSSGETNIEVGRQQMTRSVLKEMIANGTEIPDEIVLKVLVYEELWGDVQHLSLAWPVTCAVVIDFDKGKFTLMPLAGQLNKARIMTQENLADTIAAGLPEALVVCGEP